MKVHAAVFIDGDDPENSPKVLFAADEATLFAKVKAELVDAWGCTQERADEFEDTFDAALWFQETDAGRNAEGEDEGPSVSDIYTYCEDI